MTVDSCRCLTLKGLPLRSFSLVGTDNVDYYKAPKPADIEDDFTRLSRLEVKIDGYIKRHNKLSVELNTIEQNLGLILNEFNDEFQDSIGKSNNRHTQEIGVRILTKLNDFCSIDNSLELRPNELPPMEPNQKMQKKQSRALPPANLPMSRKSSTESDSTRTSKPNRVLAQAVQPSPTSPPPPKMLPSTFTTSPLVNSHSTHYHNNRDFTFNLTGIEKEKAGDFGPTNLVKAHYARVDTSTPYTTDTVTRLTHYKSTPSLVHANQSLPYESSPQYAAEESYLNDPNQSKTMYINMSSTVHSNHPLIEHCFRRIELLRPRIMGYKSEHKLSVYKELDNEIIQLMNRLDAADCGNVSVFQQDLNIAYCELHNLAGVLERAIDCTDPECVICNSFIYKQEISV